MSEPVPVLEIERLVAPGLSFGPGPESGHGMDLVLRSGGQAVVAPPEEDADPTGGGNDRFSLADLAQGLIAPDTGAVRFLGRDWSRCPPLEQAALRGRIGRVMDVPGWVQNLTVAENLTLACRMHPARRAGTDPVAESDRLARRLGLLGVPTGRPTGLRRSELRRLEWVRAFLGRPALVLLEQPEAGAPRAALEGLFQMAEEALSRGTAMLWITRDDEVLSRATRMGAFTLEWGDGARRCPEKGES